MAPWSARTKRLKVRTLDTSHESTSFIHTNAVATGRPLEPHPTSKTTLRNDLLQALEVPTAQNVITATVVHKRCQRPVEIPSIHHGSRPCEPTSARSCIGRKHPPTSRLGSTQNKGDKVMSDRKTAHELFQSLTARRVDLGQLLPSFDLTGALAKVFWPATCPTARGEW